MSSFSSFPNVSILVAARNEEKNILQCIQSLALQDYPCEKLEIIIGNDASEDKTAEIVQEFIEKLPKKSPSFKLVNIQHRIGQCKGKANVLAHLAREAKGEIFLFTDADVEVPSTWASMMIKHWNPNIGIMTGFTIPEANNLFSRFQALDWASALYVMFKAAQWHIPLSSIGNNMLISREAYYSIGGYEGIDFSMTEDHAIFKAITKKGWEFKHLMSPETTVKTFPINTLKGYIHQRKRWTHGAMRLPWFALMMLFGQALLIPILLMFGLFYPIYTGVIWVSKSVIQSILLLFVLKKLDKKQPFYAVIMYELYADIFYFMMLLSYFLPFKVEWKGRKY
jgi:cellulose synthase/poly-beta-1,6-N-acetylglucosamine synthase-like glycosyltransferase